MSVNDYVLKIKDLIDALASIGSPVDNDHKVALCLNGLREDDKWKSFITSVYVRDSMPDFDQLVALMVTEEMNLQGSTPSLNQSQSVLCRKQRKRQIQSKSWKRKEFSTTISRTKSTKSK